MTDHDAGYKDKSWELQMHTDYRFARLRKTLLIYECATIIVLIFIYLLQQDLSNVLSDFMWTLMSMVVIGLCVIISDWFKGQEMEKDQGLYRLPFFAIRAIALTTNAAFSFTHALCCCLHFMCFLSWSHVSLNNANT